MESDAQQVRWDLVHGYPLAQRFLGQRVRVHLSNGSVLSGYVEEVMGKFLILHERATDDYALVNLDYVVSMPKHKPRKKPPRTPTAA